MKSHSLPRALSVLLPMLMLCLLGSAASAQTPLFEVQTSTGTKLMQVFDDAGMVVRGSFNTGVIPATGSGVRLMWYPAKAAFRAGRVCGGSSQDDLDANIGINSFAGGLCSKAEGNSSVAMGWSSQASGGGAVSLGWNNQALGDRSLAAGSWSEATGPASIAIGEQTLASGDNSVAIGTHATASGSTAIALGHTVTADGQLSTVLGHKASAKGMQGGFVYADASGLGQVGGLFGPTVHNQFLVRASGGTIFYSNAAATQGVYLPAGGGAWATVSDVARKENFRDVDAEGVLRKLAQLPISEWNYRDQTDRVRHLGPMAQDFHAAFGLGEGNTTITTTDVDGVALLGIQALERRTTELHEAYRALASGMEEIRELRELLSAMKAEVESLRAELAQLQGVP